jgi:hypothetical protein
MARARAISVARHSGHRQRPPGSSISSGKPGIERHQHCAACACIAQSKALPQRGQRALFGDVAEADKPMMQLPIRSNDMTKNMMPLLVAGWMRLFELLMRLSELLMRLSGLSHPSGHCDCTVRNMRHTSLNYTSKSMLRRLSPVQFALVSTVLSSSLPPCPSFPTCPRSHLR